MSKDKKTPEKEICSFCQRSYDMVERLVAGPPGTYICNECVLVCSSILEEEKKSVRSTDTSSIDFEEVPDPKDIKASLDEYVIGQDSAKKTLAVAVHNHYKRLLSHASYDDVEIEKSNVLMIGPTGSGKTLLARTLAKVLKVPFAIGDATTLTEAGYVGEDVENILLKLYQAADQDIALAERGIIYIDEIDKIGRRSQNTSITRDVSGEGVQQALLKMLEGTIANIPPQGGRKHPEQKYLQMDTSNVLFICGGMFEGMPDIIANRIGRKVMGFGRDLEGIDLDDKSALLEQLDSDDVLTFGLIPELVGRVPVISSLMPLDEKALVSILTEPKNALIKQYKKFFEMEGATLEFTTEALSMIAQRATEKDTGARGLRTIIERVMLEIMYEAPSRTDVREYIITPEVIENGYKFPKEQKPLKTKKVSKSKKKSKRKDSA